VKRCGCGVSCFAVWYYWGIGFDERKKFMLIVITIYAYCYYYLCCNCDGIVYNIF